MDDRPTLKPLGLSYAGEGFPQEVVQRHQLKFSQAATLQDLSEEYAWFSLALMYSKVELMGRDPWGDYVHDSKQDDTFQMTMRFTKPVFKGMEVGHDQEWNHVLWAMERGRWDDYRDWMGRLTFIDRDEDKVTRLRTQKVLIVDPLYFERVVVMPATCPTAEVTVFVLESNHGCVYMQPGQHPLMDLPRVVDTPHTFADTKIWAAAALNNHPNPFGLVESVLEVDPITELAERVRKAREKDAD